MMKLLILCTKNLIMFLDLNTLFSWKCCHCAPSHCAHHSHVTSPFLDTVVLITLVYLNPQYMRMFGKITLGSVSVFVLIFFIGFSMFDSYHAHLI